jgi:hypothetical protein
MSSAPATAMFNDGVRRLGRVHPSVGVSTLSYQRRTALVRLWFRSGLRSLEAGPRTTLDDAIRSRNRG